MNQFYFVINNIDELNFVINCIIRKRLLRITQTNNMDNLAAIRMFVRVADASSFTDAARQLDVAVSSVSRQINALEDELSVRLFQRTTRRLSLTEAGHLYYERVSKILGDFEEARLAVSQTGSPTGILRVTAPTSIGRELLISVIPAFLEQYPGVRVVMSLSDYVLDLVESSIDVAIRVGRLSDSTLKARKVGDSRRVVCASPRYLKKAGVPKHPADLEHHNCITFREHPGHNLWSFNGADGKINVRVTGNFFARSSDALAAAALAGMGLILLPDWNIGVELRQKQLKVVLSDYDVNPGFSPVWAVHTHQRHVPPKVHAFIDFLIEQLSEAKFS